MQNLNTLKYIFNRSFFQQQKWIKAGMAWSFLHNQYKFWTRKNDGIRYQLLTAEIAVYDPPPPLPKHPVG